MQSLTVFGLILFVVLALNLSWQEGKAQYEPQPLNPTEQAKPTDDIPSKKSVQKRTRTSKFTEEMTDKDLSRVDSDSKDTFAEVLGIMAGVTAFMAFLCGRYLRGEEGLAVSLSLLTLILIIISGVLKMSS